MADASEPQTHPSFAAPSESTAVARLHQLSRILPSMARERAEARQEAARLREENARLLNQVSRLERGHAGEAERS